MTPERDRSSTTGGSSHRIEVSAQRSRAELEELYAAIRKFAKSRGLAITSVKMWPVDEGGDMVRRR